MINGERLLYKSKQNIFGASRSYTVTLFWLLAVLSVLMPIAAVLGLYLPAFGGGNQAALQNYRVYE